MRADRIKQLLLAIFDMRRDPRRCETIVGEHSPHGDEAVKRGRIEGRAEEAVRILRVADAARRKAQVLEFGEPAGDAWPRPEICRCVEEGAAFPSHRIFVPAAKIEDASRRAFAERAVERHERMISVDHDPRPVRPCKGRKFLHAVERPTASEQDLAYEDQVVRPLPRCAKKPAGEAVERLRQHPLHDRRARLFPARELAAGAMEFSVADQHSNGRARTQCREQAYEKLMRVRGEGDRIRLSRPELGRNLGLGRGPDLVHHLVPFAVGEEGGIVPRLQMPFEARVGPEVVAVRREMQSLGIGIQASAEQPFEAQRSVLSAHSSGNTRFSSVERR